MADDVIVNGRITIPASELTWSFSPSGGPGGQHANKASTRVTLQFDIEQSRVLSGADRSRLLSKLGPTIRVVADDERSQQRNRTAARRRLADRLSTALERETPRRPTRPSRGSVQRRLDSKRQRKQRKQDRGRIQRGDW
jgi:ribosome-associated protein